jgi:hypothetical protein
VKTLALYFLPKNYPTSVSPNYYQYTKWSVMQNIASAAGGGILACGCPVSCPSFLPSRRSALHASAAARGRRWRCVCACCGRAQLGNAVHHVAASSHGLCARQVIKDGLGGLGGVIWASLLSNRFDADPKRWRMISGALGFRGGPFALTVQLRAAYAMDAATLLEIVTPLFPKLFLPMASVANIGTVKHEYCLLYIYDVRMQARISRGFLRARPRPTFTGVFCCLLCAKF